MHPIYEYSNIIKELVIDLLIHLPRAKAVASKLYLMSLKVASPDELIPYFYRMINPT